MRQVCFSARAIPGTADVQIAAVGEQGAASWALNGKTLGCLNCGEDLTLAGLYVRISAAPGSGNSRTFKVYEAIADAGPSTLTDTGISVTFSNTETGTKQDTSNTYVSTFSTTTPRWFVIRHTYTGSPASCTADVGLILISSSVRMYRLFGGCFNVGVSNASSNYLVPAGPGLTPQSSINGSEIVIANPGTIRAMAVRNDGGGSGSAPTNYHTTHILKNGTSVASRSHDSVTTYNRQESLSVSVAAGDRLTFRNDPTGSPGSPLVLASMMIESDDANQFTIPGATGASNLHTSVTQYLRWSAEGSVSPSFSSIDSKISEAFTLKGTRVYLPTAPGSGKSRQFRMRVGGTADANYDVTISGTSQAGSSSSDRSMSLDDAIQCQENPSGSPANSQAAISMLVETSGDEEAAGLLLGADL